MNTTMWFVILVVGFDLVIVPIVLRAVLGGVWKPLARNYPPIAVEDGAIQKRNQSIRIGAVNLGMSVHIAVDATAMHLEPARWISWVGMSPISIPFDAMTPIRQGRYASRVKLGKQVLTAPVWALELAIVRNETQDDAP